MSAELSRRLARLKLFPPIRDLSPDERRALFRAVHVAPEFDDLPDQFQALIVAAEATRERARSAQRADALRVRGAEARTSSRLRG